MFVPIVVYEDLNDIVDRLGVDTLLQCACEIVGDGEGLKGSRKHRKVRYTGRTACVAGVKGTSVNVAHREIAKAASF